MDTLAKSPILVAKQIAGLDHNPLDHAEQGSEREKEESEIDELHWDVFSDYETNFPRFDPKGLANDAGDKEDMDWEVVEHTNSDHATVASKDHVQPCGTTSMPLRGNSARSSWRKRI